MSDEDVILNDGHPEAEAGVHEEDQHEDVVEDSVPIVVRTAVENIPNNKIDLASSIIREADAGMLCGKGAVLYAARHLEQCIIADLTKPSCHIITV